MTSARMIRANRTNAKASTGPKTTHGKFRAAQNARRHGLSISICADPTHSAEVELLTLKIAGERASPEILELAHRIAEAQIDLGRIQRSRVNLLNQYLRDPTFESRKTAKEKMKCFMKFAKGPALNAPAPDYILDMINAKPEGTRKFVDILEDLTTQIATMDRYERRALSRRKFAIRALDAVRQQATAAC